MREVRESEGTYLGRGNERFPSSSLAITYNILTHTLYLDFLPLPSSILPVQALLKSSKSSLHFGAESENYSLTTTKTRITPLATQTITSTNNIRMKTANMNETKQMENEGEKNQKTMKGGEMIDGKHVMRCKPNWESIDSFDGKNVSKFLPRVWASYGSYAPLGGSQTASL